MTEGSGQLSGSQLRAQSGGETAELRFVVAPQTDDSQGKTVSARAPKLLVGSQPHIPIACRPVSMSRIASVPSGERSVRTGSRHRRSAHVPSPKHASAKIDRAVAAAVDQPAASASAPSAATTAPVSITARTVRDDIGTPGVQVRFIHPIQRRRRRTRYGAPSGYLVPRRVRNATRAASIARPISAVEWAMQVNMASNCEGGK